MGTNGSARTGLQTFAALVAALLAVYLGVRAMPLAARGVSSLGLRPALLLSELALVAPGLLCVALLGVPPARGLALQALDARRTVLALAAGASLWGASLGLLEVQYALWRPPAGYLEAFQQLHQALRPRDALDALFSVAAIALVPAICEELLFRGIVLPSFVKPLGSVGAVLVSSVLFGAIHLDTTPSGVSFYRIPFAIAVGAGLGSLRLRTGSLLSSILAHALLNTTTFAVVPLSEDPASGAAPRPLLGLSLLLCGSLLTTWLVWRAGKEPRHDV